MRKPLQYPLRHLMVVVFALSAACAPELFAGTEGQIPRFEHATLPEELAPEHTNAEFGYLIVLENRNDAQNTRTIKLPVVILKCRGNDCRPDPILYTTGGPGYISAISRTKGASKLPYLESRDFIIIEQRGTRYAEPALLGAEIDSVYEKAIGNRINNQPSKEELLSAVRRLRARLVADGVDLTAYTTAAIADDISDLRSALGIDQWNLYGISYGCRIMLEVMRRHPDGVRSVILDSPLPPDANYDETMVRNYWNTLHRLFEKCRSDSAVSARFPDLEARFLTLLEEADKNPLEIRTKHPATGQPIKVKLNAQGIFQCVFDMICIGPKIKTFPSEIHQLCNRNRLFLYRFVGSTMEPPPYAWGMRYSVWCNEEFPFEDPTKISDRSFLPPNLQHLTIETMPPEICGIWPRGTPHPIDNEPVQSDIPVLIASGQFDPDTPPQFGRQVTKSLPHSFHIIFPGESHLPLFTYGSGKTIVQDFLDAPEVRPGKDMVGSVEDFRFFQR
jgi:pimeloyl-ACP methyl ester carboxylesterase